jgi:hypothetical protein
MLHFPSLFWHNFQSNFPVATQMHIQKSRLSIAAVGGFVPRVKGFFRCICISQSL